MFQDCCKKCGSMDLLKKVKGTNTGLYCSDCGAWIKWMSKDEDVSNVSIISVDWSNSEDLSAASTVCGNCMKVIGVDYGNKNADSIKITNHKKCPNCGTVFIRGLIVN